jgi:hypothetical protein
LASSSSSHSTRALLGWWITCVGCQWMRACIITLVKHKQARASILLLLLSCSSPAPPRPKNIRNPTTPLNGGNGLDWMGLDLGTLPTRPLPHALYTSHSLFSTLLLDSLHTPSLSWIIRSI